MNRPTATVTHLPTGQTFTVPAFTSKPTLATRTGLRAAQAGPVDADGTLACAGCGIRTGASKGTRVGAYAVETGQADRIVNDHPAFRTDRPVAYGRRTVANTCAACNGSDDRVGALASLEAVALALLAG